jgi:transposase-like protein
VEIDESKFGKRKYHRGRLIHGQWVFGLVERESGRAIMLPVEKRNAETLISIILKHVAPGTTIISDCWKAYSSLGSLGFQHLTVNHSINFKDPITKAHTNTIESLWQAVKRSLPQSSRRKLFFSGIFFSYILYILNFHYKFKLFINFLGYLAKYLFLKSCRARNVNPFTEFLAVLSKIDLSDWNFNENDDDHSDEE